MRVFVINLPCATERQASASRQLDAAGVPFEFFEAIRGDAVATRCPFDGYDEPEFVLNTGRYITEAEKGCFASHRALWMQAVSLNEPILVMEDDFELQDSFAAALAGAARVVDCAGFLRLQNDLRARKCQLAACNQFVVSRYTKPPHGAMCYCIAPRVAQRFLELTQTMDAPVDVFIKKFWEHGQPLYALTPYAVYSSPLCEFSTIARPPKKDKPLPVAARRLLRKTGWHCRRWAFNVRQRSRPFNVPVESAASNHAARPEPSPV